MKGGHEFKQVDPTRRWTFFIICAHVARKYLNADWDQFLLPVLWSAFFNMSELLRYVNRRTNLLNAERTMVEHWACNILWGCINTWVGPWYLQWLPGLLRWTGALKHWVDIQEPAINGTTNLLKTALSTPTVKRVAILSSFTLIIDISEGWAAGVTYSDKFNPVTWEQATNSLLSMLHR